MRPIKFRAWNSDEKRMEYGDGLFKFTGVIHLLEDYIKPHNAAFHGTKINRMFNGEIMQFTGLHDKYGKEIYERDIVKAEDGVWEIQWTDAENLALMNDVKETGSVLHADGTYHLGETEVIGNIYESPDILHQ